MDHVALRMKVLRDEKQWDTIVDAPAILCFAGDFTDARKELAEHEGGNDDDPADPGGRTSRGIIQSEYDKYRTRKGKPKRDVWTADDAEVDEIYRTEYWDVLKSDDLPSGVDYVVFDFGVNSGVSRSAKVLQQLVGSGVDGEIGPETLRLAKAADPVKLINGICDQRMAFLRGLKTFGRFGNGWTTRVKEVRALALDMAKKAPATKSPESAQPTGGLFAAILKAILAMFRGAPAAPSIPTSPPIMNPRAELPWMAWARKEVGFHETGVNRGIEKYIDLAKSGSRAALLGQPWCAVFANAALEASNVPGSRSAMARSFEDSANFVGLPGPAYGAIVTLWRGSERSGMGHVGFYVGENERGVVLLDGNDGDGVRVSAPKDRSRVEGYFWPKSAPLPKIGKIIVNDSGAASGGSEV